MAGRKQDVWQKWKNGDGIIFYLGIAELKEGGKGKN